MSFTGIFGFQTVQISRNIDERLFVVKSFRHVTWIVGKSMNKEIDYLSNLCQPFQCFILSEGYEPYESKINF